MFPFCILYSVSNSAYNVTKFAVSHKFTVQMLINHSYGFHISNGTRFKTNFKIKELRKYFIYTTPFQCHSSSEIWGLQLKYISLCSSPLMLFRAFCSRDILQNANKSSISGTPTPPTHTLYRHFILRGTRRCSSIYMIAVIDTNHRPIRRYTKSALRVFPSILLKDKMWFALVCCALACLESKLDRDKVVLIPVLLGS
jgi:hypothetical protein